MKKSFIVLFLSLVFASFVNTQTIDGQFVVMTNDGVNYSVKTQIKLQSGSQNLGNSTIRFSFDQTNLSFPLNPVQGTDYIFHNFQGGDYSSTVSLPSSNSVSINIAITLGSGTSVNTNYIDVATIYFTTSNPAGNSNLQWGTREIYPVGSTTPFDFGSWPNLDTSPLPVELSSFTASSNQNGVNLKWQTATEVNNYGFDVERMSIVNGQISNDWKKIGFVNGNGNSNSPKNYSFEDKNVVNGKYSYRLKQIDNDGQYEYSNVIEVDLGNPKEYSLLQNYPNPFNPSTKIEFRLPEKQMVSLRVYNILGEMVQELLNEDKEAGSYSLYFDGTGLPSGIYIYRLETANYVANRKMSLVK